MMKCPYPECTFEGTEAEVDEHVVYCIGIEDPDHSPVLGCTSCGSTVAHHVAYVKEKKVCVS